MHEVKCIKCIFILQERIERIVCRIVFSANKYRTQYKMISNNIRFNDREIFSIHTRCVHDIQNMDNRIFGKLIKLRRTGPSGGKQDLRPSLLFFYPFFSYRCLHLLLLLQIVFFSCSLSLRLSLSFLFLDAPEFMYRVSVFLRSFSFWRNSHTLCILQIHCIGITENYL